MASSANSRVPLSIPKEARDAVKEVFDALSEWRDEVNASTERYCETILEKMAAAARALGWPKELVEASHKHLVQASKAQMHMIDQFMDAWEKQISSPTSDPFAGELSKLTRGFGTMSVSSPVDLWMQTAEMWQRNWASALSMWTAGMSKVH